MDFHSLHQQDEPLLLSNVWDVASAQLAERLGFQAIGTSSAAISSMLGYEDGEGMSFEELAFFLKRMLTQTKIPLSVDLEGGYSRNIEEVFGHISLLAKWGVRGINLEDSLVENAVRTLLPVSSFSEKLQLLKEKSVKGNLGMFFNIRTDCFLLPNEDPLKSCIARIKEYEKAGADGIFIPGISKIEDIKTVVQATKLPINVMCLPDLPEFEVLKELGVKRISMGNFLFANLEAQLESSLKEVLQTQSFQPIF